MINFQKSHERALYQIWVQDIIKLESKVLYMISKSFVIPGQLVYNVVRTA